METNQDALALAMARIQELEAKLSAQPKSNGGLKISPKGALSVYGLQRFPITLYKSQWKELIKRIPEIEKFIQDNEASLVDKQ